MLSQEVEKAKEVKLKRVTKLMGHLSQIAKHLDATCDVVSEMNDLVLMTRLESVVNAFEKLHQDAKEVMTLSIMTPRPQQSRLI